MSARPHSACTMLTAIIIAGLSASSHARDPITDPEIATLTAALDDANFATRERASMDLAQMVLNRRLTERDLVDLALRPDASPEQRVRLLTAARDQFMSSPRAAMGIGYDPVVGLGITLTSVEKGFPCETLGLLFEDDIVTSIAGISMAGDNDLLTQAGNAVRAAIISHDPGDVVSVTLLRPTQLPPLLSQEHQSPNMRHWRLVLEPPIDLPGYETLTLDVPLGGFSNLNRLNTQQITFDERRAAWSVRLDRILKHADPALTPQIPLAADGAEPLIRMIQPTDESLAERAGRRSLRDPLNTRVADRVILGQNQMNAQVQERIEVLRVRNDQLARIREVNQPTDTADPTAAPDAIVTLATIRDLELQLLELERRIATSKDAADLDALRAEHRAITQRLREAAAAITDDRSPAGVSR